VAFLRKRCSAKKSHNKYDVNDPSHKPSSDPKKQDCVLNGFSEVQFSNFVGSEIKNVYVFYTDDINEAINEKRKFTNIDESVWVLRID
jgi:hypothetical protein